MHSPGRLRQQWRHKPIQLHDVTVATNINFLWGHVNGIEIGVRNLRIFFER